MPAYISLCIGCEFVYVYVYAYIDTYIIMQLTLCS